GWFAHSIQEAVVSLPAVAILLVLALTYFYSMYAFSMATAHIAAMAGMVLIIAKTAGVPALVAVATIAYLSNLCACLTPYSSGPVIIYFGNGYVSSPKWFGVGLIVSFYHLVVWLGVVLLGGKLLGWWRGHPLLGRLEEKGGVLMNQWMQRTGARRLHAVYEDVVFDAGAIAGGSRP